MLEYDFETASESGSERGREPPLTSPDTSASPPSTRTTSATTRAAARGHDVELSRPLVGGAREGTPRGGARGLNLASPYIANILSREQILFLGARSSPPCAVSGRLSSSAHGNSARLARVQSTVGTHRVVVGGTPTVHSPSNPSPTGTSTMPKPRTERSPNRELSGAKGDRVAPLSPFAPLSSPLPETTCLVTTLTLNEGVTIQVGNNSATAATVSLQNPYPSLPLFSPRVLYAHRPDSTSHISADSRGVASGGGGEEGGGRRGGEEEEMGMEETARMQLSLSEEKRKEDKIEAGRMRERAMEAEIEGNQVNARVELEDRRRQQQRTACSYNSKNVQVLACVSVKCVVVCRSVRCCSVWQCVLLQCVAVCVVVVCRSVLRLLQCDFITPVTRTRQPTTTRSLA